MAITRDFMLKYSPVLSAQLITAPTGRPKEILNFPPAVPPRPGVKIKKKFIYLVSD